MYIRFENTMDGYTSNEAVLHRAKPTCELQINIKCREQAYINNTLKGDYY